MVNDGWKNRHMAAYVSLMDTMDRRWNLSNGHAEDCPQHRWDSLEGREAHAASECPCCRNGVMVDA